MKKSLTLNSFFFFLLNLNFLTFFPPTSFVFFFPAAHAQVGSGYTTDTETIVLFFVFLLYVIILTYSELKLHFKIIKKNNSA
jgi:hypothetical protein